MSCRWIDWAEKHHDAALVDAEGNLVAKRRTADSVDGFAELTAMLAEAGEPPSEPDVRLVDVSGSPQVTLGSRWALMSLQRSATGWDSHSNPSVSE